MPLAPEAMGESQHRKRFHRTCQQQSVQPHTQGMPPSLEALLAKRLTRLGYLVNILLGTRLVVHLSSFYPRAVFLRWPNRPVLF